MSHGLVLLSGGLDSTTLLAWIIKNRVVDHITPITFFYGQKHERELGACRDVCKFFNLSTPIQINLAIAFIGSRSALVEGPLSPLMPHLSYEELQKTEGVSPTYVPFRNGAFLSLAAVQALIIGADTIFCGIHAEDARNWAYPDCTPEFIGGMMNAIYIGTYYKVRLQAPFQYFMKKDIVELGLSIDVPYEITWSCYEGREKACGVCPTCVERLKAFSANLAVDPIHYERLSSSS